MITCYLSMSLWSHGVATSLSLSHMAACCLPSPMELLHISHNFQWLLAVSQCHSQCHGFAACLSLSPMVTRCISQFLRSLGVATCLSLSPLVADCISLSLPAPWICCMSLTLSHFSGCLSISLWSHGVTKCLSMSPMVACYLSMCR